MTGLATMGARKTALHMTLLVCILSLGVCAKGVFLRSAFSQAHPAAC